MDLGVEYLVILVCFYFLVLSSFNCFNFAVSHIPQIFPDSQAFESLLQLFPISEQLAKCPKFNFPNS